MMQKKSFEGTAGSSPSFFSFLIPAGVSSVTMVPSGKSDHEGVKVLEAYVR
ncbi:hypothetical protein K413DRAFT_2209 [Clostridium sp. ASBs410]|nr:hypothetical protein K413DRAFT_2209 [Clostridium sp. ASBs410]